MHRDSVALSLLHMQRHDLTLRHLVPKAHSDKGSEYCLIHSRPSSEGTQHKALGKWVAHQRVYKRKGSKSMMPARIEELNSIDGWLWDARKKD